MSEGDAGSATAWIAADWGTTNLRLWAMDHNNRVLFEATSSDGMATTSPGRFEHVLLALIQPWLRADKCIPVIACGMVGARQGWIEVPYTPVPCTPIGVGRVLQPQCTDPRIRVFIIGGLSQEQPVDVMRGEETQVAGLLSQRPTFDGLICMPGTHTKWVRVHHGVVHEFKTWMTGEIFSLLARHSVLQHSVKTTDFDSPTFMATVRMAMQQDQPLAALFGVRAGDLIHGVSPACSRATLSGLLIATEVKSFEPVFRDKEVVVLGAAHVVELYHAVLSEAGAQAHRIDGSSLVLSGLVSMHGAIDFNQQGTV